jgi:hypothetical protein
LKIEYLALPDETRREIEVLISKYRTLFGLESVNIYYSVPEPLMNCPLNVNAYLKGNEISAVAIEISRDYPDNPHFHLSLCHELGHLKNVIDDLNMKKDVRNPESTWEWIKTELKADREIVKRRQELKIEKREIRVWLWLKIHKTIRDFKKEEYQHFIWRQLAVSIARFIAAI